MARSCPSCCEAKSVVIAKTLFPHQRYDARPPTVDVAWLDAIAPPAQEGDEWRRRMATVAQAFRQADLRRVYLIHGTFVGDDVAGLAHLLALVSPEWSGKLSAFEKQLADRYVRDSGNYTDAYAQLFARGINSPEARGDGPSIDVRLLHWTSENHHLGRADGAVRLIDDLAQANMPAGSRVLLWGHSHGGNLLALATHLLAAPPAAVDSFFKASRPFWRSWLVSETRRKTWRRVRELLSDPDATVRRLRLDIVTFGTPIRYGWDSRGYDHLLHVVYHRPTEGVPSYFTRFPFSVKSALAAKRGDYVQQTGIAGTNIPPALLVFPSHMADRRLNRLLQSEVSLADTWKHLSAGLRVPEAGDTLLIDYREAAPRMHHGAYGHAIYTRSSWLLYHAELVARRWYVESPFAALSSLVPSSPAPPVTPAP